MYDRVTKWGGAERVLLALHEIWSEAPLYTAVYDPVKAPWASVFDVRPSFLQHIPLAKTHHELFPWLTPLAFESFSFDEFDVVISVTSAEAKDIITKPHTLHICYCLTPTRYLWSGYAGYLQTPGLGGLDGLGGWFLKKMAPTLKRWDRIASARPDHFIAISKHVADRIVTYYQRNPATVIYPPVTTRRVKRKALSINDSSPNVTKISNSKGYFLVVSRLVGYKRIDIIVDAFNRLGLALVIIGDGRARDSLQARAKSNISFITGYLTDEELLGYHEGCRAVIVAADEDFGLVAAEANSIGKPVIAYAHSGVSEIVEHNKTGILFNQQTVDSLIKAVKSFETIQFEAKAWMGSTTRFNKKEFTFNMKKIIEQLELEGHRS